MKLLVIFLIIILTFSSVFSAGLDDVLTTMDQLEKKLEWLNYRISLEQWDFYTTGQSDSLDYYNNLYIYTLSDEKLSEIFSKFDYQFDNETDKRRFELLKSLVSSDNAGDELAIQQLTDSLFTVDLQYRAEFEGEPRSSGYLYNIYRTDPNPVRREKAYRAWCSVGEKMQEGLTRLFKMRNREAEKIGYNSYMAIAMENQKIDFDEYKNLLDRLKKQSEQKYLDILKNIKSGSSDNQIEIWDLTYSYANINRDMDRYFPSDSQLVFIKRSLKDIDIDLDSLPIYYDLEARNDKSQLAYGFTIKAPYDMRVLANLNDGLYSAKVLLHEIGHTLHSAYIIQDRDIFRRNISGIWNEAMAQIVASLIIEKEWLANYTGINENLIDNYLIARKEQDIIYLRTTLLRLNFEIEAYKNPNRNLNKVYWDLFEEYMHLPRHEDIYPWAALIYYTNNPVYMQNYLYADIITAQTLAYFKANFGSMVGNQAFKSFMIQNYWRAGSRFEWPELLERGIFQRLDPDYFIKSLGIE